ncbi:MAG: alpha/beta hydrolase, partial [Clostridia bacterium]|nr:alpha/beta hydrolase [Clostridia bacterium]
GWGEYGERYDGLATFLAENGYVVVAQDHLGHGRTTGYKALGVYPRKAAKYMVEDMHLLYEILHKQYKKLPYMLYGHSMGSMMTRLYLPKWGDELTAAVVCGTIYSIWPEAFLVPVINTVTPLLAKSYKKEIAKYEKKNAEKTEAFGDHEPTFLEKQINGWLSYDQDNIKNYLNDPYIGLAFSPTLLYMLPVTLLPGQLGSIRRVPKDLPVYIISGEDDMAGFWGFAPKNLAKKFKKKKRNVTLKTYPHAKHEIHNEAAIKDEVFADILNFFNGNNPKFK